MRTSKLGLLAACLLALIGQTATAQTVSGSATYRERIAPPPDARFEATLLDVSRMDAPATELGRAEIEAAGPPPYAFEIDYDPSAIDPAHSYAVRATLWSGDRLIFTTDTHAPVLTRGAPDRVELVMVRAGDRQGATPADAAPTYGLTLPASFTGRLPCADCAGIDYHLDLWPDQAFHLRRTWRDGPEGDITTSDLGLWSALPGKSALKLWGLADTPAAWRVVDDTTLRQLDMNENEIDSALNYTLTSDGTLDAARLEDMFLGGMMTYMADAATFTECLTGRSYPVAQDGDYRALERAYLAQRAGPGAPLYVHVEGGLLPRPAMEGPDRPHLVVDRFVRTRPGITCERQRADAALTGTYWRIDSLMGEPVPHADGAREPHMLVTEGPDGRYVATVGCNQLVGGYTLTGESLSFGAGAATMMACPPPLDARERRLAEVLRAAASHAISGETLMLKTASGETIALMTARYMR